VRFVIRVSERLNLDIPREDWPRLATVGGCAEYLRERV
jgi:acyl carrier protein